MNFAPDHSQLSSSIPDAFGGPVGAPVGVFGTAQAHPLLNGLNEPQKQAVCLPAEHGLILAGAGSGKTRVLTTRIAWLMQTGQVSPQGILAVTFTNKAAREMLTRLSAMVPINVRSLWVGTFHGLCHRLLRTHWRAARLPETFQILDTGDQQAAIKRLIKAMGVDEERFPPRDMMHYINALKEQGIRSGQAEAHDAHTRRKVEIYAEYEAQCQREGAVDFAELLLRAYELLQQDEALRTHYQQRFRHILVDEFQDTNPLQYAWLQLLCGPQTVIFAVGDDDQSIYAFRGADVANMRAFERNYAKGNVIRLEQNYRSHGNILTAANALITNNADRLGKNLWTDAGEGELIRVFQGVSDLDEARYIVDEIRELTREGLPRHQMALLYRSNAQSRVLEHALFQAGIAYRVYGGLRFFERMEVKHALAYLRLIANQDDDTAFLRVVNFPTRGIGARSLEALQVEARQLNSSLYNAAASLTGKAGTAVGQFIRLIEGLRTETTGLSLPEVIDHLLDRSGLRQHYQAEKDGQDRLENLEELVNAAATFADDPEAAHNIDRDTGEATSLLADFLAHAALEAGEHQAGDQDEAVQLMTVHSAKGLEFSAVFIVGLEQGLFPHENAMMARDGLEEERRLMYVAITRARQRLYLCHAQTRMLHGQTRYCLPSSFLDELPEALLQRINTVPAWSAGSYSTGWSEAPAVDMTTRVSARAAGAAESAGGFHVGQSVVHAKFGAGVILAAEGRGEEARVQVRFGQAGTKWLALAYAKLEAA
ncbi:UvrD-helicase domain-containing protein [Fluviibacter phosphoraccumulans]|uniref:UvrD-helicase domain-containing protein n=1 Tax=Fluviibacter phosphoraccumulans TaxID=1751046 RepID=UPI0024E22C72|nr:UvrD-helicase domain-containing protein [Fluviibacter phosphoraccumulans]